MLELMNMCRLLYKGGEGLMDSVLINLQPYLLFHATGEYYSAFRINNIC